MANAAKEIKVSLKLLANVTDAKKLTEYIHTLGQELKKSAGPEADALRQKLLAIKKAVYQGDRSAGAVKASAQNVAALMPDISKSKALGSLGALDAKLTEYGTAQANVIRKTVADMNAALNSGSLSSETVDALSSSLGSFVEQANKLPPEGLKKLGGEIQKVVTNTEDLNATIAEMNGIDFKIDIPGKDTLFAKIDIGENVAAIQEALSEAIGSIDDFGEEGGIALQILQGEFDKLLKGGLSQQSVKRLDELRKKAVELGDALSSKGLTNAGNAIKNLVANADALKDNLSKVGVSAIDSMGQAEYTMDLFNLTGTRTIKTVVEVAKNIPLIGKALSAIPIMWLVTGIAVVVKAVTELFSIIRQNQKIDDEIKFENARNNLKQITESLERDNFLLDLAINKERAMVSVLREQQDAMHKLVATQNELNREKAKTGMKTQAEREAVDLQFDKTKQELDAIERKRTIDREKEDNARRIAELEKANARLAKAKQAAIGEQSKNNEMAIAETDSVDGQSWWNRVTKKEGFNLWRAFDKDFWTGHDPREAAAEYERNAQEAAQNAKEAQEQIIKNEQEIAKLKKDQSKFEVQYQEETKRVEKEDIELKERQRIENERIAQVLRNRAREFELFARDEQEERISYQRDISDPWRNLNEKLAYAQKELGRWTDQEKAATEKRDAVLASFNASGRVEMNEQEDFEFRNATSDLTRARSNRYGQMSTIASLQKQIHDRKFDEAETQYQYGKEDRDFARAGRYSRANWSQRLRMDVERYREGQRQFAEAQAQIDADNAGTRTLSPEQRRIVERNRNEGREKMTSMRENIRSAAMEGDTQKASFLSSLFGHRNRLTAMGLGGDVANWDKQTASNTRKMVQQNEQVIRALNQRGGGFGWGM